MENMKVECMVGQFLKKQAYIDLESRLSLSSQSHIYPLGIAEDVLVEATGFMYPVDFIILDIKEGRKRPFILRTPFLTTVIFDEKKLGNF
ncbi:hypothetical protein Tco_1004296 [Tanacetum coccineum]|uniref:Uncharacterized protein n=1 Tax=Tanacetum coccineum TaxID=301880 RepID=A0ABQ5FC86_9ASTR